MGAIMRAETLSNLPLCMVSLDPTTLQPLAVNDLFQEHMGPLYKFQDSDFSMAATEDSRDRFRSAMQSALDAANSSSSGRIRVRNIEMVTLAGGSSGFPLRRFFDWFLRYNNTEGELVLLGDYCSSDQDVHQREQDAEWIDFFENAPIALHWLTSEGKILWANQTELRAFGYTEEEFIGHTITDFCHPEELPLFREIFQQLGDPSKGYVKDVPARFLTKQGEVMHLLIDSNVRYEKDGSFCHTRCFVRDDTARKIKEARASLLLEETKRSLQMLDNFMARSIHHLRTPLHVTQTMVDAIGVYLQQQQQQQQQQQSNTTTTTMQDCMEMVHMANEQIHQSVALLDDVADLAKFDQGGVLHMHPEIVSLEQLGRDVLQQVADDPHNHNNTNVEIALELRQSANDKKGPSMAVTDPTVLTRILKHLLNNALHVTQRGRVVLEIGYTPRLTFAVTDTGPGLELLPDQGDGDLPVIFQRYHQELLPDDTNCLVMATTLRERIEQSIASHQKNGMGIGLSLTYHLVQSLGGELQCTSRMGEGTRFSFSLPYTVSHNTGILLANNKKEELPSERVVITRSSSSRLRSLPWTTATTATTTATILTEPSMVNGRDDPARKDNSHLTFEHEDPKPCDISITPPVSCLASQGVKCQEPPSILVVEDNKTCAKMLCRTLSVEKCATKWVENGKLAVELLQETTPGTYDLIIMDLRMPVMDGLEATRIIKGKLEITTPVIALTGDDNERTREEADGIGFDGFYGKPLKRDKLKEILAQFTGYRA
ncbi:sensor kinase/phosphatase LuxQ [Seminavis robusta]|uniref:histidine kinase n=1 Tax=Seminavis robusta TaxID=568900 RepID=A0A9N8HRG1_9STRA|nr:sensor kinase/phosphatase LuxQ [Seminavis robusta]|eukprot:Sro1394_g268900.1 sensor kinase/phosphatase LuxQ (771) ;mRNA; r:5276-7664